MTGLVLFVYAGSVVAAVILVRTLNRRERRVFVLWQGCEALSRAVRSARRRFVVAIGFTALLLFAGFVAALAFPRLLGMPVAIAPAIAGAGGLLLYAVTPPASSSMEGNSVRVASLELRHAWSFASRRSLVGLAALFGSVLVLLLVTGLTSSPDDAGRYRAITFMSDSFISSAMPYPGWFYAIPLITATILLAVTALLALRRIASVPSLPGPGLERQDRVWRIASTRILTTIIAAIMSLQLGGIAVFAGSTAHNAAFQPGVPLIAQATADTLFMIGIVALGASLVWFTLATLRAFELPQTVAHDAAIRVEPGTDSTAMSNQ